MPSCRTCAAATTTFLPKFPAATGSAWHSTPSRTPSEPSGPSGSCFDATVPARGPRPRHRRERPPLEPLADLTHQASSSPPPEPERQPPDRVADARLTCGQTPAQAWFAQISPKREDLTTSEQAECLRAISSWTLSDRFSVTGAPARRHRRDANVAELQTCLAKFSAAVGLSTA